MSQRYLEFPKLLSTLKVKRPQTPTLSNCIARHINRLAVLHKPSPLALLPILGHQPTKINSEEKKKRQKKAPNNMTLQKTHRSTAASLAAAFLVQSAASWKHTAHCCFTCSISYSSGFAQNTLSFSVLFAFLPKRQQLQSRQKQASPQELMGILPRPG